MSSTTSETGVYRQSSPQFVSRPNFLSHPIFKRFFSLDYRRRLLIESLLLVLALLFAGIWFGTPYIARHSINRILAGQPDYKGRVEWVEINPLDASFDLYDFHLDKRTGEIPVHFFYSPRWHIALQWSQIIHGVFRSSVTVFTPRINLVAGPDEGQSQVGISGVWIDAIKQIIPLRVNQVRVIDGDLHFLDFHADPQVNLEVQHIELNADNMSNSEKLKVPLPATVELTARPLIKGYFQMNLAINFDEKYATFSQNFKMEHVPAVGANSALEKYAKVEAKSGEIALYSQLTGDKGVYHGYVKPFFTNLEFEPKPADRGNLGSIWSGILNAIKGLFENDQHAIATEADISGRVDEPKIDVFDAIGGVLWNAYIQAIASGFDPKRAPSQPTDTVTTPQSAQTEAEAASHTSPADKK